jgi:hypothetical protein
LLVRLEAGIPSSIAELASVTAGRLTRGDYLALLKRNLNTAEAVKSAKDDDLLKALGDNELKVAEVKRMAQRIVEEDEDTPFHLPILPPYKA